MHWQNPHQDVRRRIAAGDPLGKLLSADLFRFQKRAVAIVHVVQDAVEDARPQHLVVRVGEFVVDDLR